MSMFLDDIASCHAVPMRLTGVFTTLLDIPIATPAGEIHFLVSVPLQLHAVARPPVWDSFVQIFGRLLLKIGNFLFLVTLKFDGWPWKTIGHLFNATLSFVHHFKVIGEFKLELQSGNAQFGSKSPFFCPVWSWNLMDIKKQSGTSCILHQALCIISKPWVNSNWSYSPETLNLGQNQRFFCPVWPWNLTDDLEKIIGHLYYVGLSFEHHSIAISKFKLELQSGNTQCGPKSMIFLSCVTLKFDLEKH